MKDNKQAKALERAISNVKKVLEKYKENNPGIKEKYKKLKQLDEKRNY